MGQTVAPMWQPDPAAEVLALHPRDQPERAAPPATLTQPRLTLALASGDGATPRPWSPLRRHLHEQRPLVGIDRTQDQKVRDAEKVLPEADLPALASALVADPDEALAGLEHIVCAVGVDRPGVGVTSGGGAGTLAHTSLNCAVAFSVRQHRLSPCSRTALDATRCTM